MTTTREGADVPFKELATLATDAGSDRGRPMILEQAALLAGRLGDRGPAFDRVQSWLYRRLHARVLRRIPHGRCRSLGWLEDGTRCPDHPTCGISDCPICTGTKKPAWWRGR